jgi:hypothetical protein
MNWYQKLKEPCKRCGGTKIKEKNCPWCRRLGDIEAARQKLRKQNAALNRWAEKRFTKEVIR